jgi:hypothetical protein
MASIKLTGDTSGEITISAPAVAGTNTITLPASTFTIPTINGTTQADIWRLTTNVTADTSTVTNFERSDDNLTGYLGTGMSESSGVFTFPETGLYLVQCQVMFAPTNDSDNIIWRTNASDGAGTTNAMADCQGSDGNTSSISQCIVDVQTTSYEVSFQVISLQSGGNITGNTNDNVTSVLFLRLGDT